jgi:predicted dehydrogenase
MPNMGMRNNRYKTVIIGMGERGKIHLHGFLKFPNQFEVVGICDRKHGNIEEGARLYGIPAEKWYNDADKMMRETRPDILAFATLPHIRLELVELAAKYRVKGLLFEKPMAVTLAEAAKILDICEKNNIKTGVCQQHKYLRSFDQLRSVLRSGELGDIREIHASCKAHASQLATHYIDYMIWANGGVRAKAVTGHVHGNFYLRDNHPSPDYIMGQIVFENGVRGFIECGYFSPQRAEYKLILTHGQKESAFWTDDRLTVIGTKGYAWAECGGGYACFTANTGGKIVSGDYGDFFDHEQFYAQERYTEEYGRWLEGCGEFHSKVETAYHGFEILEAIYRSALDYNRIDLPLVVSDSDNTMERLGSTLRETDYRNFSL